MLMLWRDARYLLATEYSTVHPLHFVLFLLGIFLLNFQEKLQMRGACQTDGWMDEVI